MRGKSLDMRVDDEVDFLVTKDHVQTDAPGLAYRASMDLEDRDTDNRLSTWGSTVSGVPVGDDWVRVGTRFLPVHVGDQVVLERTSAAAAPAEASPEAAEAAAPEPEPEEPAPEIYEEEALVEPEILAPELEPFDGLTVQFGVLFRSFPALDFHAGTFTAALALTQRWPTADAPPGPDGALWRPHLGVMNHDIGGVEAISTSTILNETDGVATQVDYLTVRVRKTFHLELFPFDQQVLSVHVAPVHPGNVNMRLMPMHIPGERSMEPELLEDHGFFLVSVAERGDYAAGDVSIGSPARGIMEVALDRRASAYTSTVFLPALLLLGTCWVAFFLPFSESSHAFPQMAISATTFLAMLVLNMHVEQLIPARDGRMWIDVFTESISMLVFAGVVFHTFELHVHSHMGRPAFATKLGRELRIFYPLLCAAVLSSCCLAPWSETLTVMSNMCRFCSIAGIFGYVGYGFGRARKADVENKASGQSAGGQFGIRSPR